LILNFSELFTHNITGFHFRQATEPGLDIQVTATGPITIALTPLNLPYLPMVEIQLGVENNQRSVIRKNQSRNVANMSTPNILDYDDVNVFRVTWVDRVVLVFREGEEWPFMAYTLEDAFNIQYYGLKSP
jgi:hypothetical protein